MKVSDYHKRFVSDEAMSCGTDEKIKNIIVERSYFYKNPYPFVVDKMEDRESNDLAGGRDDSRSIGKEKNYVKKL